VQPVYKTDKQKFALLSTPLVPILFLLIYHTAVAFYPQLMRSSKNFMLQCLFFLVFLSSALAQVRILTFHCNHPEFIKMQHKTLRKFLLDDYELIVFNDAKTEEMEKQIEEVCQRCGILCVRFQPAWHLADPLNAYLKQRLEDPSTHGWWGWSGSTLIEELANHPSVRHSHVIQYALDHYGYDHNDIVALMDGDNFLIKPLSIRELLQQRDIVGFHQRGDEGAKRRLQGEITIPEGEEMPWVVFTAFDPRTLPDVRNLHFHVDVVSYHPKLPHNTIVDTGAAIYRYLGLHPELRLQAYPWQDSYTYRHLSYEQLQQLQVSDRLIQFLRDIDPENVQLFIAESFMHLSASSFERSDPHYENKLFQVHRFLEDIVEEDSSQKELRDQYEAACQKPSDICEHVSTLRALAAECSSVVEIGTRSMVSTWGLLQGLAENRSPHRSYLGIDLEAPPQEILTKARWLAQENGISFSFWQANDMDIDIEPTELLFIDSLHTYCHLTYELETFSPKVKKYIALHDTSWERVIDDPAYQGDYSEYPPAYDRTKRGLWAAVEDFLDRHPEWTLHKRYFNNNGFTILKRKNPKIYDCFLFFNELDILEIKLHELYDHVDHFVLVESVETFRGKPKPLYFAENKERFLPFLDKIIHVALTEQLETDEYWNREYDQRNQILRGLAQANDGDIIIIEDLDEIVAAATIPQLIESMDQRPYVTCAQSMYTYFLNRQGHPGWDQSYWLGSIAMRYSDLKRITPQGARDLRSWETAIETGWHFTYMGGIPQVRQKLESFSHAELDNEEYKNPNRIRMDIDSLKLVEIDETFPQFVRDHIPYLQERGLIE
jgi:hypothetical protein